MFVSVSKQGVQCNTIRCLTSLEPGNSKLIPFNFLGPRLDEGLLILRIQDNRILHNQKPYTDVFEKDQETLEKIEDTENEESLFDHVNVCNINNSRDIAISLPIFSF